MKIKKYEASSIESALYQIRQELGPDAIILHTQKIKKRGMFGLFGKNAFEVTAALDVNLIDTKSNIAIASNPAEILPGKTESSISEFEQRFKFLQKQLSDVAQLVSGVKKELISSQVKELPELFIEFYSRLLINQLEPELAEKILIDAYKKSVSEKYDNPREIRNNIAASLEEIIKIKGAIKVGKQRKVIALVGPTGVGKTTTLAKLAAHFTLVEKIKTALITADTYRIAAVDQLKTYSEIIEIPLEVVVTPQECRSALAKHLDKEIILVDTAGRSSSNKSQIDELSATLEAFQPHETHLVLSATTNVMETLKAIEMFGRGYVNRIIFTKLDEALTLGQMINILYTSQIPLSYITNGQNVPNDIAVINTKKLVEMILEKVEDGDSGSSS